MADVNGEWRNIFLFMYRKIGKLVISSIVMQIWFQRTHSLHLVYIGIESNISDRMRLKSNTYYMERHNFYQVLIFYLDSLTDIFSIGFLYEKMNSFPSLYLKYGLPWWINGKESACQCRRHSMIPGLERSPGEGNGNPLQYSCLGNPMDRGARQAIQFMGLQKNQKQLSD